MATKHSIRKLGKLNSVLSLILGFGVASNASYADTELQSLTQPNDKVVKVMADDGECVDPSKIGEQQNNKLDQTENNNESGKDAALANTSAKQLADNAADKQQQNIKRNNISNKSSEVGKPENVRYVSFFAPTQDSAPPASLESTKNLPFQVAEDSDILNQVAELEGQKLLKNGVTKTIDLTLKSKDLWQRIHNGFAMPNLDNSLVKKHQAYYEKNPTYVKRMVSRGSRYLYYIVSELNRRNMPTELALLPMVESAFNPMAYSSAKAAGLWQFIPSTGRQYKLTQNWWQDERRDVVASTNAALDYLQYIYDLHGDWQLALASYNYGENGVARAVRNNRDKGLPTDYDSLRLPNETKNYVPKLQALKNILGNMDNLVALDLPTIENKPYFTVVKNPQLIDLSLAASLADLSESEFKELNPSFNRPVIMANESLVIPAEKVKSFREKLENYSGKLTNWQMYSAEPGERLNNIAAKFSISLAELKSINGIRGKSIDSSSTLLVPTSSDTKLAQPLHDGNIAILAQQIENQQASSVRQLSDNVFKKQRLKSKKNFASFSKKKFANSFAKNSLKGKNRVLLASADKFSRGLSKKSANKQANSIALNKTSKIEKAKKNKQSFGMINKKNNKRVASRSYRSAALNGKILSKKIRIIAKN